MLEAEQLPVIQVKTFRIVMNTKLELGSRVKQLISVKVEIGGNPARK